MSFVGRVANDLAMERLIAAVTRLESKVDHLQQENVALQDQIVDLTGKVEHGLAARSTKTEKVEKVEKVDPKPAKMVSFQRSKSVPTEISLEELLGETLIFQVEDVGEKERAKAAEARAKLFREDKLKIDKTFLRSARTGKLEDVKRMLEMGAYLDVRDSANWTALIHAAANGFLSIVQVVLAKGAMVDASDDLNMTALMFAAYRGYASIVHALVSHGANINLRDSWGRTALQFAKGYSGPNVVRILMDADFVDNYTIKAIYTMYYPKIIRERPMAIAKGIDDEIILDLLDQGIETRHNNWPWKNWTSLHFAARGGYIHLVKALLYSGSPIDAKSQSGRTALHVASAEGQHRVVEILISQGAEVDCLESSNWTPLMEATCNGHLSAFKVLLAHGANVNARSSCNNTPLILAAQKGNSDILQILLSVGADCSARGYLDRTAFVWARENRHTEITRILEEAGK